ncbi:MAG: DUF5131 family protein [Armatimonadota bacterium]
MKGLSSTRIPYLAGARRWDPITGCSNNAEVCAVRGRGLCWAESMRLDQARKAFNKGYGSDDLSEYATYVRDHICMEAFKPQFHEDTLQAPGETRKSHVIAVGFGGDMWTEEGGSGWRRQVFDIERAVDRHTYIHLTKCPDNIQSGEIPEQDNIWVGVSVLTGNDLDKITELFWNTADRHHSWVSFEPIMDEIMFQNNNNIFKTNEIEFVVIGGLSDGTGHVMTPEEGGTRPEWVQPIINQAYEAECKVFLKNLQPIIKQIIDPRTGKPFNSQQEWRETPWK